jgi:hypothetical protein
MGSGSAAPTPDPVKLQGLFRPNLRQALPGEAERKVVDEAYPITTCADLQISRFERFVVDLWCLINGRCRQAARDPQAGQEIWIRSAIPLGPLRG